MASIRKRTWTTNGVAQTAWVLDYRDNGGKRRLKTFATKKEAEGWSVTALHEVAQGVHTAGSASITVSEGMRLWIEDCEANGLEFGTIKQRQEHKRLHVDPFIGSVKLAALTAPALTDYFGKLRKAGRSLTMRRKVLTNIRTMLRFCQATGKVAQNVALAVTIKGDDNRAAAPIKPGVDFPDQAELRTIIDNATGRWRPIFITAVFTGMRISELRGLPWSNVKLDKAVIEVRQRADAWGRIGKPKSKAGNRDIPLTPMVVNALRQWKDECPASELDLVFPNGAGNVENYQNIIQRGWEPLQLAHGMAMDAGKENEAGQPILVGKYGFHALRHAAASLFIEYLKWTPKRVQVVMGHSSIQQTFDVYAGLFSREDDVEAMRQLESAIAAA